MGNDKKYKKLIQEGVDRFASDLSCKIDRNRNFTLCIELDNGYKAELSYFDMLKVAQVCDVNRYATEIGNRLEEPERYTEEHYRQLREMLDARGAAAAAEIARSIDDGFDEIVEEHMGIDFADDFATEAAAIGSKR